jgi:hypothetical protein
MSQYSEFLWVLVPVILLALVFLPFLAIWSVNALFPAFAISYGFKSWFAMFILMWLFGNPGSQVKK